MANDSERKEKKKNTLLRKLWNIFKRGVVLLFWIQLLYIILLKWVDPPITLTQLNSLARGHGLKRDYVKLRSISPYAGLAVISSEDQLFTDHHGFDWKSIKKAMAYNKRKPGRVRGASTISQQVAKNVFLWQGRSWIRKALEVYFTFMIENLWGKKRILEVYLNVIEMGDGIFGIEAAAHKYFNKPASKLSPQEAAMIAACLPNPRRYRVKPLSNYVAERSKWVLQQMGFLSTDTDIQKITGRAPP
ncbi:MAG TPA: monofunctional biosynthetic peptidoglycan transglycosylase [Chitinophagaceae bacterium]|nr:monofunctional biosynthetic peptidoglycan transglycosylase [Chitinophagaceae bacterium]